MRELGESKMASSLVNGGATEEMRRLRKEGRDGKFTLGHVELEVQMLGRMLDIQQPGAQKKVLDYR